MNKELFYERKFNSNPMFPFDIFKMKRLGHEAILDCHWHNELEFFVVTEGRISFQVGTELYDLSKGQAVFINSGEIHAGHRVDSSTSCAWAMVFSPAFIAGSFYDVIQHEYLQPLVSKAGTLPAGICGSALWERRVLRILNSMIRLYQAKPTGYELSLKASVYQIFFEMISAGQLARCEKNSAYSDRKAEKLKSVLDYIEVNYSGKISVSSLAQQIDMSKGHFLRFFKQMVKKTPMEYINNYRINMAARILVTSDRKILDVAIETGYDSCSYFINTFKKIMKCTPSEYRKNNR